MAPEASGSPGETASPGASASLGPTGPLPSGEPLPTPQATTAAAGSAGGSAYLLLTPALVASIPKDDASFPAGYTGYHTYAQLTAELAAVAAAHPDLVQVFSIGRSYQGRQIWAARVSQDVTHDHGRPEALFDGVHHALEHLSLEMTLTILHWLVDGYGHDATVTSLLRQRVVDIVFAVNPDGAEFDVAVGTFHGWRKNRQPNPGSSAVGTDLNRNYGYHWECCGLVGRTPASAYYAGPAAFSAPESRALTRFVESRVIDGHQRIRVAITFHTAGRLVMWPYGYTRAAVPYDMTAVDHAVFVALGRAMAARNGYLAEQASGLYVDSGTSRDWEYGRQHIFAFTFELGSGTYMPSSIIGPETARNRAAMLYLIGMADCPYRAIGKAATYCSAAGG